jgi:hypothetical protein
MLFEKVLFLLCWQLLLRAQQYTSIGAKIMAVLQTHMYSLSVSLLNHLIFNGEVGTLIKIKTLAFNILLLVILNKPQKNLTEKINQEKGTAWKSFTVKASNFL